MVDSHRKKEVAEEINGIRDILWNDWDPIGVNQLVEANDEYDRYVHEIYAMFLQGTLSREFLVAYLLNTESSYMGLNQNVERARLTADKLILFLGL